MNEGGAVVSVSFVDQPIPEVGETGHACARAVRQLEEYFQNERRRFELELEPEGSRIRVQGLERGATNPLCRHDTYGEIARASGSPMPRGRSATQTPQPDCDHCSRATGSSARMATSPAMREDL